MKRLAAVATATCDSSLATARPVTEPAAGGVRWTIGISRIAVPAARMYASAIFATVVGTRLTPVRPSLSRDPRSTSACRVRALLIALVEIQLGIQFRLTRKQLLQAFLMFEGTVRLCLVVHKLLLCACHAALLFCRQLVQAPQRMLDALDRPNRIRRIQVRGIRGSAADEQFRDTLVLLKKPESAALALAQNLEAAKLHRAAASSDRLARRGS